jgi:ParB family chromosome partitioning protein
MSTRVPISDVRPDAKQPRQYFREAALKALAASIKKTGQRQPITVRQRKGNAKPAYEIIDGERRWRACKMAGIQTIRIDVEERDLSRHSDQHLLSLTSNFMREGHTHMEISQAVQYQIDAAVDAGMTRGQAVSELSESIGKSDAWIYQYLQLQQLCSELQAKMHPAAPDEKRLRFAEAVVLAPLSTDKQKSLYRALLRYPSSARAQQARRLSAEATGVPIQRRTRHLKRTTSRFVVRVAAEIERVLDYKQNDFRAALAEVPEKDRKAFRDAVALLLAAIDGVPRVSNISSGSPVVRHG